MPIKSFKPTTPSLRYKNVADFSVLTPKSAQPKKPRKLLAPPDLSPADAIISVR